MGGEIARRGLDAHRSAVGASRLGPLSNTVTLEEPLGRGALYVLVLEGSSARTLPLPATGEVELGRDEGCFIALTDDSVSRRHAKISLGDETHVEDLGSKNGTRVEGRPLAAGERAPVRPGALVEVGDVTLVIQRGAAMRPSAGPTRPPPRDEPESAAMRPVLRAARCVANDDITVLLLGETGVGKEVLAERIHRLSPRSAAPFVRVHCAAISESLFESELFGHEKGAFTGATSTHAGLLEGAQGGTVFIDEVGELPPSVQVKLLRVLEDRRVRRVGGRDERALDVRFVAATNRDLETEVAEGRFRQDLYFRLSGFTIRIPALRDRQDEILPLARVFLRDLCDEKSMRVPELDPELCDALRRYAWPGNVRELKNVVRRLLIVAEDGRLRASDLPLDEMARRAKLMSAPIEGGARLDSPDERTRIIAALEQSGGNQTEAAKLLGVSRRTLIDRLDRYGIARPRK
ncbi:MAG: sigma 54-interacting transcriptional regulator [Myxococcales bacterium]|nr:sigma 54-interacting transcriptional regulator [Myxococcales bacterium]